MERTREDLENRIEEPEATVAALRAERRDLKATLNYTIKTSIETKTVGRGQWQPLPPITGDTVTMFGGVYEVVGLNGAPIFKLMRTDERLVEVEDPR